MCKNFYLITVSFYERDPEFYKHWDLWRVTQKVYNSEISPSNGTLRLLCEEGKQNSPNFRETYYRDNSTKISKTVSKLVRVTSFRNRNLD